MAVTRLRSRRDARQEDGIARLRKPSRVLPMLCPWTRLVASLHMLDRELSSRRGWGFVMVEPHLYAGVVTHLTEHSRRPLKAVRCGPGSSLCLPPDSNEVMADREELARMVGIDPRRSPRSWASWRPSAPSTGAGRAAAFGTSSTRCSAPTWPAPPATRRRPRRRGCSWSSRGRAAGISGRLRTCSAARPIPRAAQFWVVLGQRQ